MRTIVFVEDRDLAIQLVHHYTELVNFVFFHEYKGVQYLNDTIPDIENDILLCEDIDREVIILVNYIDGVDLSPIINYFKDKYNIESEVV